MTTITPHIFNHSAELRQLVLFPELLGVTSVPLNQGKQDRVGIEQQEECQHSLQAVLVTGQMTLW